MTPEQLSRTTLEYGEQRALFAWANMACSFGFIAADTEASYKVKGHALKLLTLHNDAEPRLKWLYAIKNQERGGEIAGGLDKAIGVKSGVSDICLPVVMANYSGMYIELKRRTGGRASKEQLEFGEFVEKQGYYFKVVNGWYLASRLILNYCKGTL